MLSIIITAYRQPKYLLNTLAGIAVQLTKNPTVEAEVIVVDNGSVPPMQDALPTSTGFGAPLHFIWRSIRRRHFRPGSARNIGLQRAQGDFILFLDVDCVPGPSHLGEHLRELETSKGSVLTIGHRIFVDGRQLSPDLIQERQCDLSHLPVILSDSNYRLRHDRRLEEFRNFDRHPMPFNCCHGCNLGVRKRDALEVGMFDPAFDGYWGYEDIEFGYRMWAAGAMLRYLSKAYVYHQEGDVDEERRSSDRHRNFELACERIPGFKEFRDQQGREYYR